MEELIVEGLDYEDFVQLKKFLLKLSFSTEELEELVKVKDIIGKLDQIIDAFN
jgi:hypothetical protein|tara:strand:- start:1012 stop:1170 length:159 start_codon:yes stop_codon:yes gene_type:complete